VGSPENPSFNPCWTREFQCSAVIRTLLFAAHDAHTSGGQSLKARDSFIGLFLRISLGRESSAAAGSGPHGLVTGPFDRMNQWHEDDGGTRPFLSECHVFCRQGFGCSQYCPANPVMDSGDFTTRRSTVGRWKELAHTPQSLTIHVIRVLLLLRQLLSISPVSRPLEPSAG
jgi:hypothetical protein